MCDHGARADHRSIANINALEDDDARADPDLIADADRSADQRLIANRASPRMSMIMVCDVTEGSDQTVKAEFDRSDASNIV